MLEENNNIRKTDPHQVIVNQNITEVATTLKINTNNEKHSIVIYIE